MSTNILWAVVPMLVFANCVWWWNIRVRHETPAKGHWYSFIGCNLLMMAFGTEPFRNAPWFWYVWGSIIALTVLFLCLGIYEGVRRKSRQE